MSLGSPFDTEEAASYSGCEADPGVPCNYPSWAASTLVGAGDPAKFGSFPASVRVSDELGVL